VCSTRLQGDVDAYNRARIGSTIGFSVAVVGAAAGVVLLLAGAPPAHASAGRAPAQGAF
jgi:hypothetical protein